MSDAHKTIDMCTTLFPDDTIRASERAVEENPDNAPEEMPTVHTPNIPMHLAIMTRKLWSKDRAQSLRVKFVGGHDDLQEQVAEIAKEWEQHANVRFKFGVNDADAEIRVAFEDRGHWSYVGTDALGISPQAQTLNIQKSVLRGRDDIRRVVLHEFGHALGAIHEHQSPDVGIPWDRERVFEYYQRTQGWDRAKTTSNILRAYDFSSLNFSEYDPKSIMHYPIQTDLTVGDFSVSWNRELSEQDRRFIATQYPGREAASKEIKVGEIVSAEIGNFDEIDRYHFTIGEHRAYQLDTLGPTDVTMALYGPNDKTKLIASDDDSGQNRNARLAYRLPRGDYFVKVRHQRNGGTGAYKLHLWQH